MKSSHLLFVVSAPSGTGKTSLCIEAVKRLRNIRFSVSHTTRAIRPGEQEGKNYQFVTSEAFERLKSGGGIAEWTEIYGNRYGTARSTIERAFAEGSDLLFDIDERGGRQLTDAYGDAVATILVLPPSLAELRRRLTGRGTEDEASLRRRLAKATEEMAAMSWYRYVIINDTFEAAVQELAAIITAERSRRRHGIIEELLHENDCPQG